MPKKISAAKKSAGAAAYKKNGLAVYVEAAKMYRAKYGKKQANGKWDFKSIQLPKKGTDAYTNKYYPLVKAASKKLGIPLKKKA